MDQPETFDQPSALWVMLARASDHLEKDPEEAERQAHVILKFSPGQQHALQLLVGARRVRGDMAGARAMLEAMAAGLPQVASLQYELGQLLAECGDYQAAVRALSRVVELEPKHPQAWRALGDALADSGDSAGAAKAYARQFESSVMDLKMLEQVTALGLDQLEITGNMLREFLNIYPTDLAALQMLGQAHMRVNQFEAAESVFSHALELVPSFRGARIDYVSALHQQLKGEEENRQLDILLESEPDNPDFLYLKATALFNVGRHQEAIQFCENILRDSPEQPKIWLAYAYALRISGRQEDCIAAYRKVIGIVPDSGEAWWGLANLKTFRFSPGDIEDLRALLARENLAEENRYLLQFALGKALEDRGAYEESFEQYSRGNALIRSRNPYNAAEIATNVQREKTRFTRAFFEQRSREGCSSSEPVFIVGLPRAGSTLVEQILASHSTVEGGGELPPLNAIARRLDSKSGAATQDGDPLPPLHGEDLRALGEEYLERTRLYRRLGRPHFTDKMPNNFHHLGLMCAILPKAKIVDVRRHPLACGFSNFKQVFQLRQGAFYDLADMGHYYRGYVELLAHFDAVLPGRVHRVFYEDLVRDPEREIRRLLEYCGLPFEETCLRFHETDRGILTVSSEQVRRPVYTDSIDQWRHYERWLGPLKAALGPVLDAYPAVPDNL